LIPGIVWTGIIFAFTYMCIHYLHHIHPPTTFSITSAFPPVQTPLPSALLFLDVVKQKPWKIIRETW
jgi:hypothetical protein